MANIDENTTKIIKENLEKKVVPKLQKEIEKEVTSKLKTKDPGEILSNLDPNVRNQLEQLTEDSQPVIPKNQLNEASNNELGGYKNNNQVDLNRQIQKEAELNKNKKQSANALLKKSDGSVNNLERNIKPLPVISSEKNEEKDNTDKSSGDKSSYEKQANELSLQKKAKTKNDDNLKAKLKGKISGGVSSIRLATDNLLKKSILSAIPTWSLSLVYSYIHVFLHAIFPKIFCSLGQEWAPSSMKKTNPKEAEKIGNKIGIAEKPAVGGACLSQLFLIIFIIMVIYCIVHPKQFAWEFLKDFVKNVLNIKYE